MSAEQLIRPESLELAARAAYEDWIRAVGLNACWEDEREAFIETARIAITVWCEAEGIEVRS
jgi:hypothetical protein